MAITSNTSAHPRILCNALLSIVLVIGAFAAGCSSGVRAFIESVDEEESLVFGYLDMKDAPSRFDWVTMKRIKPLTGTPYYNFAVEDGLFYRTHTPRGTYKFDNFGGYSFLRQATITYSFPQQGKGEMDRVIPRTGIYFVGAYRYKKVKTGLLEQGKFEIVPIAQPTEKGLLTRLLDKAEHPTWKTAIKKRIAEIKQ